MMSPTVCVMPGAPVHGTPVAGCAESARADSAISAQRKSNPRSGKTSPRRVPGDWTRISSDLTGNLVSKRRGFYILNKNRPRGFLLEESGDVQYELDGARG